MNIDIDGRNIIAEFRANIIRDFAFFLSQFRALDQNNFYSGKNGFPYKEEEKIVDDITIVSTIYPDETVNEMSFKRQTL